MRKVTRRSDLIPEKRRRKSRPDRDPKNDILFLQLLKAHHLQKKFKYMQKWWEQTVQE